MLQAVLNMLMGMGSVFVVLILICLCIYCFQIIPYIEKRRKERQCKSVEDGSGITDQIPQMQENVAETTENEALVAVIMAAITAYTGLNQDEFIVRSIVRK